MACDEYDAMRVVTVCVNGTSSDDTAASPAVMPLMTFT
jgi:hypothetical protein